MTEQAHPRDPVDEPEPASGPDTARERVAATEGEPGDGQDPSEASVSEDPTPVEADEEAGRAPRDDDQVRSASSRRAAAAWYAGPAGPTLSFGFNLAKIPDQGEDADPIVRDGRDLGLVAVFDGMGGAGGTVYETPDGRRTGAYLASRVARDVVEERMLALLDPEWNLDTSAAARDLQRSVRRALADTLAGLNAPKSGLRSRLLRALPTTMAVMGLQRREPRAGRWAGYLFWAGDSRVYVFHQSQGAHQLTLDDIRDAGDAMANLRQDSVVSNAMSADIDFVVNYRTVELTAPFLVVAATDGCFGYVPTPMHFEHLVLSTLQDSSGTEAWSRGLQEAIAAVTGDDAAMAVLGVGADHDEFRRLFAPRAQQLERECILPLDTLDDEIRRAEQSLDELRRRQAQLQASLWRGYKPEYQRHLDRGEER